MKGKRIVALLTCICLVSGKAKGQSLYEIKFTAATTDYVCLLVYFNEQNSYMRIAYTMNGVYNVVNVNYKSITGINKQNENYFYLKSIATPNFITTASKAAQYKPDYFIWYGTGQKQTGPYQTDSDNFENQQKVKSYTQLTPVKLTDTYLRQFFNSTETAYFAMRKICGLDKNVLASLQLNLPSTKMHFVMAANTRVSDIGLSCTIDERSMETEFRDIAKTLGVSFARYTIMDDDYSKETLDAVLAKLQPGKDDIVVFAYSGHGFRWHDQSEKYPNIDLRNSSYSAVSVSNSANVADIYNTITAKGARLNIILTDCCNSDIGRNQLTTSGFLNTKSDVNPNLVRLQRLFMNARGNVIATAAQPGEFSWGNNSNGGYFTSSFIQALREEISYFKTSSSSWSQIIDRTLELAKYKTSPEVCPNCKVQSGLRYSTVSY